MVCAPSMEPFFVGVPQDVSVPFQGASMQCSGQYAYVFVVPAAHVGVETAARFVTVPMQAADPGDHQAHAYSGCEWYFQQPMTSSGVDTCCGRMDYCTQQLQQQELLDKVVPVRSAHSNRFWIASLAADLKGGNDEIMRAVMTLRQRGVVRRLSFQAAGCRVVQTALDLVDRRTAAELVGDLRGHVAEAIRSPHANYVVQKVAEVLAPSEVPFIVDEIAKESFDLARHEYGCRVLCRLLENSSGDSRTARLIDEVLANAPQLLRHVFGHHLIERALEHGSPQQQQCIISALKGDFVPSVWNRYGTYVLEKALLYSSKANREALAWDILAAPARDLSVMAANQYGTLVARALLNMSGDVAQRFRELLCSPLAQTQLNKTKYGRRLCVDIQACPNNVATVGLV